MTDEPLAAKDYPLAEKQPEKVAGARGLTLPELTLDAVMSCQVEMADLRITAEALMRQAQIARAAGREALARNFERAAEMTRLPQPRIMQVYEKLRPGRAENKAELLALAQALRDDFAAEQLAALVEEAAEIYEGRRLFSDRF